MRAESGEVAIQVGAKVLSADGKQLGRVKEADKHRFRVDARWAPDYWLGMDMVAEATEERLELLITKGALGAEKLSAGGTEDSSRQPGGYDARPPI